MLKLLVAEQDEEHLTGIRVTINLVTEQYDNWIVSDEGRELWFLKNLLQVKE